MGKVRLSPPMTFCADGRRMLLALPGAVRVIDTVLPAEIFEIPGTFVGLDRSGGVGVWHL